MRGSDRRTVVVLCLLALVALAATGVAGGNTIARNGYSLAVEGSVDTPSVTRSFDGVTYEVDATARVDPGIVRVTAETPTDGAYRVYAYNNRQQILTQQRAEGNGTLRIDLRDADAGSYVLSLTDDGVHQVVHPVLVRGYEVDASVPDRAPAGGRVNVTVETRHLRGADAAAVTVLVANGSATRERTLTASGPDTYAGRLPTAQLAPGNYTVYATVRGSDRAFGERELLGFRAAGDLRLTRHNGTASAPATPDTQSTRDDVLLPSTDESGTTATETPTRAPAGTLAVVLLVGVAYRLARRRK